MSKESWIKEETQGIKLGDKRLDKRLGELLTKLSSSSSDTIPRSCGSWSETIAAYRFFNNKNVSSKEILSPHESSTLSRIEEEKVVLILQDTTDINYSNRKPIKEMGYLKNEKSQGLYLHPSIAVTPEKLCLGVVDAQIWSRDKIGVKGQRKQKPIEQKESYRWLKGYNIANKIAKNCTDTMIVNIADREGDIYEVLEKTPSELKKAYWLIRSSINRRIESSSKLSKLHDLVKSTAPLGKIKFELPEGTIYKRGYAADQRTPRKPRTVTQQIRVSSAELSPPKRKGKKLSPTPVNIIHCEEITNGKQQEKIEWFLITSVPVKDFNTAKKVINWYLCRWQIESFFKILKSGCVVEKLQLKSLKAITNSIALYLIIAWRILYLTMLTRIYPGIKCNKVFSNDEWQSVYILFNNTAPPKHPPKLEDIILIIAQLGGFLNRKSDGAPGNKAIWIGLQRLHDFSLAWNSFRNLSLNSV